MSRTKPAEERRSDLLDSAEAVFVERGVAAATLDEITTRACVAKGTFYLYFRSKDEVVVALQKRFGEGVGERVAGAVRARRTWSSKLDAVVTACFSDYTREYALHEVLFHQSPHVETPTGEGELWSQSPVVEVIRGVLEAGVADGAYDIEDVELTAVLLYSAVHGAFEAGCHGSHRPPRGRLIRATQQLARRVAGVGDVPQSTRGGRPSSD